MLDSWYFAPLYCVVLSGSCSPNKITCEWSLLYVFWLLCGGSGMWQAGILCAGKAVWWSAISIGGVWESLCCHLAWNHGPVFLQEHKAPGRGSEKLPGGACRTHFPWLEHGSVMERQEESVCVHRPSEGLAASPQVCCVCAGVGPGAHRLLVPLRSIV